MSSGSPSERSTSGGYSIFHTHLPTAYPPPDQDSPWVSSKPENTSDTSKEKESLCFPIAIRSQGCLWSIWGTWIRVDSVCLYKVLTWSGEVASRGCQSAISLTASAYKKNFFPSLRSTVLEIFQKNVPCSLVPEKWWWLRPDNTSQFHFGAFPSCSYPFMDKIVSIKLGS